MALKRLTTMRLVRWGGTGVAMALVATVVVVLLSARLTPAAVQRPRNFGISDDVRTSFGIVAVEFVRSVDPTNHRALPASTFGASDRVKTGIQQIQVAIALTNQARQPLNYSVRQFDLWVTTAGKLTVLAATATDLPGGRILPDAGIEGHLDFTLPAAKSAISLHFRDPGSSAPVVIDLGTVAATAAPAPAH